MMWTPGARGSRTLRGGGWLSLPRARVLRARPLMIPRAGLAVLRATALGQALVDVRQQIPSRNMSAVASMALFIACGAETSRPTDRARVWRLEK